MNLFDGQNGRSDGAKDGVSATVPSGNNNISVSGVWDGASVTIERYSKERNDWFTTQAVWTDNDVFQGLVSESGERYRLLITSAGASTKLYAEI
ncbi:hypothetical protein NVP1205O_42 [Vibrio phage 1.205.O._10N.222.51.A7]|nr:hypothetical protein NVP1205O_42 [Vibrio phage 1.205.O._10N.222.51.A7]